MAIDVHEVPTEHMVLEAMKIGEGQQIEFKATIPAPNVIGSVISGFADAAGGLIFVGIREQPTSIVGCDYQSLTKAFDRTVEKLSPADSATLHRVTIEDKDVGVISVKPGVRVVTSEDGIFTRVGAETRRITIPQAKAKMSNLPTTESDQLAKGFVLVTETVENLRLELAASRTLTAQLPGIIISFVVGCVPGVLGNYIFKALGN